MKADKQSLKKAFSRVKNKGADIAMDLLPYSFLAIPVTVATTFIAPPIAPVFAAASVPALVATGAVVVDLFRKPFLG